MDSNTFIYLGVLIVALLIPIAIHQYNKNKKQKMLMAELTGRNSDKGITLAHFDLWRNNYAIGLDNQNKILYYVNRLKDVRHSIPLSDAASCRQQNDSRMEKSGNRNYNIPERLDLVISYNDKSLKPSTLEFYDHTEFMTPDGELPLIEKWEKLINTGLSQ